MRYGGILLAAVSLCFAARGQDVTARAWVDSTQFLVGDWIAVHVDLRHPAGTRFRLLLGDTISGFQVIDRGTIAAAGEGASVVRLVVARYDSGRALLPPLPFQYMTGVDTATRTVSTNPLLLTIHTIPVDTTQDIRDIKPPVSLPYTLLEVIIFLAVLLAIAAGLFFYFRHRKRRPAAEPPPAYIPPPRPAHVIALEELGTLKDKRLWQQGLLKPYYSELTEIFRRYFENRYRFMALEETTGEILASLRLQPGTEPVREETERVLRLADLVKFAKLQPGPAEHEEAMRIVLDVVQRTASAAGPSGDSQEASDVAA